MYQDRMIVKYLIALLAGLLVGFKVLPAPVIATIYMGCVFACGYFMIQGNIVKTLLFMPYIVYSEIFIRGHVRFLPYLTVQYMYIIGFGILLIKTRPNIKQLHFKPIIILALFFFLELINSFAPYKPIITNAIQLNTFALLIPALWASFYKFSPVMINKLMDTIRLATIYLGGIVLVAHLQGKIDYGGVSSSEASNNMAPVQLSGYLGTGAILFLISILNPQDKRNKIIQGVVFVLIVTLMVLTFSRGGVYFLAVITLLYMFFNRTNFGNYFKFLIFIPIGLIIYNFVVDETGGKIIDRYKAKGASNREELVAVGLIIFYDHPISGIGTGNYNTYIKKSKLFSVESGAHNEFIRAAAEHGIIGVLLYWGFFISLIVIILQRQKPAKEYALYFVVLFILITIHNGLKISIQPFLLMLAIAIVPIMPQRNILQNVSIAKN